MVGLSGWGEWLGWVKHGPDTVYPSISNGIIQFRRGQKCGQKCVRFTDCTAQEMKN